MWHRPCRWLIHLRSETRQEPTSRWCGVGDSAGVLGRDLSVAPSSAEHSPRPTTPTPTPITDPTMAAPTPIMDPTTDMDIRSKAIVEGTVTTGSSVAAIKAGAVG